MALIISTYNNIFNVVQLNISINYIIQIFELEFNTLHKLYSHKILNTICAFCLTFCSYISFFSG